MSGKQPFYKKRDHAIMMEVTLKRGRPRRSDYSAFTGRDRVNDQLWDLLERCWAHTPKDRPTAAEVSQTLIEIERGTHTSSKQSPGNVVERSLPSRAWRNILIALIDACFFLFFLWVLVA
ncbi:unnamed protein product [Rhizoctonia solani]|uniref:Serine-threonine/tyrosine-protein kinase catalytic domain-containing protein n=1 Tax=Rhizoctonia solani TaxID=456999 RepID=A0A8H3A5L4_9AGAM|nr:unnamed protein product [Rhizoctonia solani]CAE6530361.1 unnamed protein product [Rhizoctonia solani]